MIEQHLDVVALRQRAREDFIAKRTIQEQRFNKWYADLLQCPKDKVLDKIPFDYQGLTMQKLIPEWYAEVPNKEVCDRQLEEANKMFNIVNDIFDELNKEGIKSLQKYNELYSGK